MLPGGTKLAVGNAIRLMARAPKSREATTSKQRSDSAAYSRTTYRNFEIGAATATRSAAEREEETSNIFEPFPRGFIHHGA